MQSTIDKRSPVMMDTLIGKRIRAQRLLKGFSQTKLAEAIGVTFQQLQKYETGTNRISAGRLHCLSVSLEIPITHFFQDEKNSAPISEFDMHNKEILKLVSAYYSIDCEQTRRSLFTLVKGLAK